MNRWGGSHCGPTYVTLRSQPIKAVKDLNVVRQLVDEGFSNFFVPR